MTAEEIAVKLEGHDHEIKSLKHRIAKQEEWTEIVQELAMSVKELSINMKNMMEELKKTGEQLNEIKNEPIKQWKNTKRTIVTSIASTVTGAVVTAIIMALAQYL